MNSSSFSSRFSGTLAVLVLGCSGALAVRAQDPGAAPDPQQPQAVNHMVWVGYDAGCTKTSPGPNQFRSMCDGDTGLGGSGVVTTINVGDTVTFDSAATSNHDFFAGTNQPAGTVCTTPGGGNGLDPGGTAFFQSPVSNFTGVNAYIVRFDKPGVYWYYCTPHKSVQTAKIVVNPTHAPCTGSACQSPLLTFVKIAVGQNVMTVCGFGTQTGPVALPGAAAAGTVLCWSGNSLTPVSAGGVRVFRDTSPAFNPAASLDYRELTDPVRQTCLPNYTDSTVLPAGKSIFYYRICDNAACTNS